MNNSISIKFGEPLHGWMAVDIYYQDFHLNFNASNVLNNPISELSTIINNIKDNDLQRIVWWLEPGAYFIDIQKNGEIFSLKIIETGNLHNSNSSKSEIITIQGNENQILKPIFKELHHFYSQNYHEKHW
ncbi:hypothetical protein M0M57_13280 [Flavobacterium azooxidireducens]|uniref:Uncharacterized protein n=1 Tax=Flavobacterium azooxidireducens TaxID=1871076 RepID=A0ABY4KD00_9FLAO|nr:hypothetical protein [Flavobacterium azooxidireducens]UPQ78589.1 hypothetical protein M0M57_13280 [Flavobacterium azooxidireducens]